jgi:type IV pilus assembly protein PilC
MPKFSYKAITTTGDTISGEIEAESIQMVNNILASRGYIPQKVTGEGGASGGINWEAIQAKLTPIKSPELILFTKQLKTMLRAGVPIMRLLEVLENQTENLKLRQVVQSMNKDIKEGFSLHEAFLKHPKVFSPLYCSMIKAGEASGALPEILERLLFIIEHEHKVKSDLKAALQYPIIVLVLLVVAFIILLTFVIPKFVGIFEKAGVDLPLPTQITLIMYRFLEQYWMVIVFGAVAGVMVLVYYLRTEQGKFVRDSFLMKVPILGSLYVKAAMTRFASIFSILQSSGVAILDSMKILSGAIGNAAISKEFSQITDRLEEGRGIAGPLRSGKYFTPLVINMVAIGEESGNLEEMLQEISEHYDSELEYGMKKLSDAVGPMLTVGLAAVIGFFALAIFLPMWDLTKMVK